jgi:radical SAM protein with 4Fe4S-binding SPASM domain
LEPSTVLALLADLEQIGVRKIAFSGGGEPLFWGLDRLGTVASAAARFASVSLTSSGDQLWDRAHATLADRACDLLKSFQTLYLNIPDIDAEGWSRQVTKGNSAAEAWSLLEALLQVRADRGEFDCRIYVVVVVTTTNISRIGSIDKSLSGIGVDGVYFKQFKNFEGRNVRRLRLENDRMSAAIKQATGGEMSPSLAHFLASIADRSEMSVPCWANRLSFGAIVDPNGDVYLCTPYVGQADYAIGNIHNARFSELWVSSIRKRTLEKLSDRSARGLCLAECREHAINRAIDGRAGGLTAC